jgi:tRNA A-37 threonylcarbamoyl transferase component Bud32
MAIFTALKPFSTTFVMGRLPSVYPNFVLHRSGGCKIWFDPNYADPALLALLKNPDGLFDRPGCEVIKDQRKIKVVRVVLDLGGARRCIYIKRYNAFSLRNRLASIFTRSGGVKSLRGAAILFRNGIATAKPIAAFEDRLWGAVTRSFFLAEEIEGGVTVDSLWRETLSRQATPAGIRSRQAFLTSLGSLFHALHSQGVYHNDLKDANILAATSTGNQRVGLFLLDLEGVRQYCAVSERRRIKNLVQLNRTLGRYLRNAQKLFVLRAYLDRDFAIAQIRRRIIGQVVRESKRLDAVKLRHGAGAPALVRD